MKTFQYLLLCMLLALGGNLHAQNEKLVINLSGNSYVTAQQDGARITNRGLSHWTNAGSVVSTYFYLQKPNVMELSLNARGQSSVEVSCNGKSYKIKLDSDKFVNIPVGKFKIKKPGYIRVDIKGVKKKGDTFGEVRALIAEGIEGKCTYVTNFSDYWGRRGPSVHIGYKLPAEQTTEWFYNEVTVPEEGEVMHSYYMAAGFGEGYFGMQFNSPTERRILFSVWSPFDTQDPKKIPDADKIKLLAQGKDVHIGEFGNEGSGGQSYLKYNWKAGKTYPFLMHIRPDGKGNTVYTAYFYATDDKEWRLIASFLRPKTDTWYTNAHSFLENFSPEQGYLTRKVLFGNQWALGTDGEWRSVTDGVFTHDATAGAGVRLDYQGGLADKSHFYLMMGGFFNESTPLRSQFTRSASGEKPAIDLKALIELAK